MGQARTERVHYEPGDIPGVDRPWQYGDVYYWGNFAMRVTDPEMMNLPPLNLPTSFLDIEDVER